MIKVYLRNHKIDGNVCTGCHNILPKIKEISAEYKIPYEVEEVSKSDFDKMKGKVITSCVERGIKYAEEICQKKCGNGILFGVPTIVYKDRVYVGTETSTALKLDLEDERAGISFKPRTMWRTHGRK